MKDKLLSRALALTVTALFFGALLAPAVSYAVGHIVPIGKTYEKSSQLVLWFDEVDFEETDRDTWIQVTNTSIDTPVWVHVQIIFAISIGPTGSSTPPSQSDCMEVDFNDFYTPNDTHIYEMDNVVRNDPLTPGQVTDITAGTIDDTGAAGFVVITPIDAPGTRNAIAHQHMIGKSWIQDDGQEDMGFGLSAMGRDAVGFPSGAGVPDGTVLNGNTNGLVLIQPQALMFQFVEDPEEDDGVVHPGPSPDPGDRALDLFDEMDVMSIAFRDNYDGVFGYIVEPADAVWRPLQISGLEVPASCPLEIQNCFFIKGANDDIDTMNTLFGSDDSRIDLCDEIEFELGWTFLEISGLEGLENELGLVAHGESEGNHQFGGSVWMYAE